MSLDWLILRIRPIARLEFEVMYALNQHECQALVPFEVEWVKVRGKKSQQERKHVLFPRYVFSGFKDLRDYEEAVSAVNRLAEAKGKLPPIVGALEMAGRSGLAKLSQGEVDFIRGLMDPRPREILLRRALKRGDEVLIKEGPFSGHTAKLDSISGKRVSVMLKMFDSQRVVRLASSAVEAA